MKFYSTKDKSYRVSFEEALLSGLAPDGGLFMPEFFPKFSPKEKRDFTDKNFSEAAFEIAQKFVNIEIPRRDLKEIIFEAYDFPVPLHKFNDREYVMELFHGPTLAFKDIAARFIARCVSYFLKLQKSHRLVLVATSGDTGGAVGHGFLGVENAQVVILYPKGGVSPIQEAQLTTMGKNIQAIEIEGTFDDCQRLVKEAFLDTALSQKLRLMSANSINIGRMIPQSFYYFWYALKLQDQFPKKKIIFSIPSGNFGNMTGAIFAKKMGAPIHKILAANNFNHPFVQYLETGEFVPRPSKETISNAMDIGHPNNYYRIREIFGNDKNKIKKLIWGAWFDDEATKNMMRQIYEKYNYVACPHTAVGLAATEQFRAQHDQEDFIYVTASTAHPAKFRETIDAVLDTKINIPRSLADVLMKEKENITLRADYKIFKAWLQKKE